MLKIIYTAILSIIIVTPALAKSSGEDFAKEFLADCYMHAPNIEKIKVIADARNWQKADKKLINLFGPNQVSGDFDAWNYESNGVNYSSGLSPQFGKKLSNDGKGFKACAVFTENVEQEEVIKYLKEHNIIAEQYMDKVEGFQRSRAWSTNSGQSKSMILYVTGEYQDYSLGNLILAVIED